MNTSPTAPETPNEATQRAAERVRHRQVLNELVELGADVARMVHRQIKVTHDYEVDTGTSVWPAPDRTVAFERVVRCVRRTILLIERLDEPVRVADSRRDGARTTPIRAMGPQIEDAADPVVSDRAFAERREQIDCLDSEDWLDTRPMAVAIAALCRDLGRNLARVAASCGMDADATRVDIERLAAQVQPIAAGQGSRVADITERPERFFHLATPPRDA